MIIKNRKKKRGEGSGGGCGGRGSGNGSCHNLIKNGLAQPLEYTHTQIKCKFSHSKGTDYVTFHFYWNSSSKSFSLAKIHI
jgi:hypothetical protein